MSCEFSIKTIILFTLLRRNTKQATDFLYYNQVINDKEYRIKMKIPEKTTILNCTVIHIVTFIIWRYVWWRKKLLWYSYFDKFFNQTRVLKDWVNILYDVPSFTQTFMSFGNRDEKFLIILTVRLSKEDTLMYSDNNYLLIFDEVILKIYYYHQKWRVIDFDFKEVKVFSYGSIELTFFVGK